MTTGKWNVSWYLYQPSPPKHPNCHQRHYLLRILVAVNPKMLGGNIKATSLLAVMCINFLSHPFINTNKCNLLTSYYHFLFPWLQTASYKLHARYPGCRPGVATISNMYHVKRQSYNMQTDFNLVSSPWQLVMIASTVMELDADNALDINLASPKFTHIESFLGTNTNLDALKILTISAHWLKPSYILRAKEGWYIVPG